ncbi:hypothetical protein HRbin29_01519 [bacterium HR29]|nr:hypothetical protein HRbin29_01519 [bacterium HR29]
MSSFLTLVRKEIRDAAQSRWLVGFALSFGLLVLLFARVQSGGDVFAEGFNRTTAGLLNLALLAVPLLALLLGAAAVATEREQGTLATLLSQPIGAGELLLAKYAGLTLALWAAVALGFGLGGLLLALVAPLGALDRYLVFVGLAAGLASASASIGVLLSVLLRTRLRAMAAAVLVWLVLTLFYELAAIAVALTISASGRTLLLASLLDPVEAARILGILAVEPNLEVLGPLGAYLATELGTGVTAGLLASALVAWVAAPLVVAVAVFRRQDV